MFAKVLRRIFLRDVKIRKPAEAKLYGAVNHFFPPRSDICVTVCDFGPGRAERREVRLGDIEKGTERRSVSNGCSSADGLVDFHSKPEWSTVRWMCANPSPF